MSATRVLKGGGFLLPLLLMIELAMGAYAQTTAQSQVPEIHQLTSRWKTTPTPRCG